MYSVVNSTSRRAVWLSAVLLTGSLGLAACDDDSPLEPGGVDWQAELAGDDIDGTASVTSSTASFEAGIAIENGEEDAVFTWHIAAGTCTQQGNRLGAATAYPDLEVADDGTADAEASLDVGLDEEEEYIAVVADESGDDPVIVACGDLEVQE